MGEPVCSVQWCQQRNHQFWDVRGIPSRKAVGDHGILNRDVCVCPRELKGDPDIAGLGVIAAFIAAAGLTLVWTVICLLLSRRGRDDDDDDDGDAGSRPRSRSESRSMKDLNPIDRWFRDTFCGPAHRLVVWLRLDPDVLADCFYDGVIALGDQQLATGLGMLVAAAIRLFNDETPLSVYHLTVVTDLAWFSSNCHLLALIVIRSYGDSAKRGSVARRERDRRRRAVRADSESRGGSGGRPVRTSADGLDRPGAKITKLLRVLLMLVLAALLLWLSWLSGDERFDDMYQCPAVCLVNSVDEKAGEPRKWLIVNFFYVLYNYPVAVAVLSTTVRDLWMDVASSRIHAGKPLQWKKVWDKLKETGARIPGGKTSETARSGVWWRRYSKIAKATGMAARRALWLIWVFLASETWDVIEVGAWFVLGVIWIFEHRQGGHEIMAAAGGAEARVEDSMGFGQLLPIFLLILPLIQFWESYAKHSAESEVRKRTRAARGRDRGRAGGGDGGEEASKAQHPAGRGAVVVTQQS